MSSELAAGPKVLVKRGASADGASKITAVSKTQAKPAGLAIPLLDLTRKYRQIAAELGPGWDTIFASMRLFNGANLAMFEKEFAAYCGVKHVIGVASGTDA